MKQEFVLGPVSDFPAGSHPIVEVGGRRVGIYNIGGEFFAVQNLCPHALGPICSVDATGTYVPSEPGTLVYGLEGRVLRCPWHGWEYDIATGEALYGVDKRKLATFAVAIDNGSVVLTMRPRPSNSD
jgi:nitrite reductase (NADH) small subunit